VGNDFREFDLKSGQAVLIETVRVRRRSTGGLIEFATRQEPGRRTSSDDLPRCISVRRRSTCYLIVFGEMLQGAG